MRSLAKRATCAWGGIVLVFLLGGAGTARAGSLGGAAVPGVPVDLDDSKRTAVVDESGRVRIGGVEVDPVAREVRLAAVVNMQKGLLEYALVGDQGKLHESLLRTEVEPYSLQIALLLLGLRGADGTYSPSDPASPREALVDVWVEWEMPGEVKQVRMEQLILNDRTKAPMDPNHWIFTGSEIRDGVFMAQAERSIIAIFTDPLALINTSHPGASDDTLWFAAENSVPQPGTAVSVVIRRVAQ